MSNLGSLRDSWRGGAPLLTSSERYGYVTFCANGVVYSEEPCTIVEYSDGHVRCVLPFRENNQGLRYAERGSVIWDDGERYPCAVSCSDSDLTFTVGFRVPPKHVGSLI